MDAKIINKVLSEVDNDGSGVQINLTQLEYIIKEHEKQILLHNDVRVKSEQLFLFYKELQKAGRLYNDNLSDDIMKKEVDWYVTEKN